MKNTIKQTKIGLAVVLGTFAFTTAACDAGEMESGEFRDDAAVYDDDVEYALEDEIALEDGEQGLLDAEFDLAVEDEEFEYVEGELVGEAGPGAVDDIAWGIDAQEGCSYRGVGSTYTCWSKPSTSTKKYWCARRFGGSSGCYKVGSTRKSGSCWTWGCYKNRCC